MATPHTVAVTLSSGTDVDVFVRYTITLDMMRAGNPWTVSMWRSISGAREASWEVLRREVKLGENITLSIDGAAQITGRIETLRTAAPDDKGGATMVISGRGLGHTGGTLDKMVSIPGWRASLSHPDMLSQLDSVGAVFCAAGAGLARRIRPRRGVRLPWGACPCPAAQGDACRGPGLP